MPGAHVAHWQWGPLGCPSEWTSPPPLLRRLIFLGHPCASQSEVYSMVHLNEEVHRGRTLLSYTWPRSLCLCEWITQSVHSFWMGKNLRSFDQGASMITWAQSPYTNRPTQMFRSPGPILSWALTMRCTWRAPCTPRTWSRLYIWKLLIFTNSSLCLTLPILILMVPIKSDLTWSLRRFDCHWSPLWG